MHNQDIPHLSFVGMKSHPQSLGDRKNRSGHGQEHKAAWIEHGERQRQEALLVKEAQAENILSDVSIGQFADRDSKQGDAIDHSIKTGEPLFPEQNG